MSRRAKRRSTNSRAGAGAVKWLIRALCVVVVLLVIAVLSFQFWLKSYLHSDDFRSLMGQTVGDALGAKASFGEFQWQGMQVDCENLDVSNDPKKGGLIQSLRVEGIDATLNLSVAKKGVWQVSELRAKRAELLINSEQAKSSKLLKAEVSKERRDPVKHFSPSPSFLDRFIPKRTEVLSTQINSLNIEYGALSDRVKAEDLAVQITSEHLSNTYEIDAHGGNIATPWSAESIRLTSLRGKYHEDGRFFLNDFSGQVYQRGLLTMTAQYVKGEFTAVGDLEDVRMEEMVSEDWKKRLLGDLAVKFRVDSSAGEAAVRGEAKLKSGMLTALPILDQIAAYTNTERFRRLNLSTAEMSFSKKAKTIELTKIIIASEGLMRVTGYLTIQDGALNGRFRIGMMPGVLANIPGAETKVFIRGDDGLLWSTMKVTGTLENPKEDLTGRMITAAYERMFEIVPETGMMALKFAHDTAVEIPESVAKNFEQVVGKPLNTEALGEAVKGVIDSVDSIDVIEGGTDVIKEGVKEGVKQGLDSVLDLISLP